MSDWESIWNDKTDNRFAFRVKERRNSQEERIGGFCTLQHISFSYSPPYLVAY